MLIKRWNFLETDNKKVAELQQELRIHPAILKILIQRGVETFDEAKSFFRPDLEQLHNPFLMKDMHRAVARISKAVKQNEKILIFGDYDVDGTTAVSLVYLFLKPIYENIEYYIPHRYREGYGISTQGIDYAAENNFSLVIALDCGIKSIDKIEYANSKGVDFIICDHHLPDSEIPNAVAVLDPKQSDCNYPYKELSGCGVGFKLVQAFSIEHGYSLDRCFNLLDLVCVSIAADIVPITGENRILAFYGLKKINSENILPGLKSLKTLAVLKTEMTITDVVFGLAPRINAAGRMDDAKHAVKLLTGEVEDATFEHAEKLHILNSERKNLDRQITEEALAIIEADEVLKARKTTVVFNSDWHKGVIGIVASRLTESYYRPTIVLTESDGKITGSARSVKQFNLYEAIYACREYLIQFGGHQFAAGLTMQKENLEHFSKAFEAQVASTILPENLIPEIEIDAIISLNDINNKFYSIVEQLAPFGPGNMKPVFVIKNLQDSGYSRLLKDEHIKLVLKNGDSFINGIAFNMADKFSLVKNGAFDIAFNIEENEWNGNASLQLMIKEIRESNS
ncbi:MAG: single-stranded-DNA-specific exonuclease RecJ [Bacteroidetes bacterium 37-13]|nr:MAG: single-stranded-DNA-specific exonuclease RecJ [Bacteroidetes bacterium 37-13]